MFSIKHSVFITASPERIFKALTEPDLLRSWWAECETNGKEGGDALFVFEPGNFARWRIEHLIPGRLVQWYCTDHNYNGNKEFCDTNIEFRITAKGGGCLLEFEHSHWKSTEGGFRLCTEGWRHFVCVSLKNLLERGEGQPHCAAANMIQQAAQHTFV